MLRKSTDLEKYADERLSDFAVMHSAACRDEEDPDDVETYRTRFKRDRDRILYTKAFRRMQSKTQVLASTAGDHHRTRLTHSLEVMQLAGSMADALGLNRDLAEAIALGHDLGHSPFGHAAERELATRLAGQGGFSHAVQSVRCIEHLERRLPNVRGLNLCVQVREGILKHDSDVASLAETGDYMGQWPCSNLGIGDHGSLESQLVYWADKIAYLSHDWEDFGRSGIMAEAIEEEVLSQEEATSVWSDVSGVDPQGKYPLRDLVRAVNKHLLDNTARNLHELHTADAAHALESMKSRYRELRLADQQLPKPLGPKHVYQKAMLVGFDEGYAAKVTKLREFLDRFFIRSPKVVRMDALARQIVGRIFEAYTENSTLMPWKTQKTYAEAGKDVRVIADHIACMTDRYAIDVYRGLFMP